MTETWEDVASEQGLLRKDGMCNMAGKRMIKDIIKTDIWGSYENGLLSFLEDRLDD